MGLRRNKTSRETQDSNPKVVKKAEELPPLEFKGKRSPPGKNKNQKRREREAGRGPRSR